MSDKMTNIWLMGILTAAVILRVMAGIYLGFNAPPDHDACGADAVEFEALAWSLAQGHGYVLDGQPTAFRSPGYPILLAGLYKLFGHHYWLNKVMLIVFSVLTVWLVFVLMRRLKFKTISALIGAGVVAFLPTQIYYTGHFLSESIFTFFNLLSVVLIIDAFEKKGSKTFLLAALAGLACGCATLTRAQSLLFPVLAGGLIVVLKRTWKDFFRAFVVLITMFVCMLAVVLPWSLRNKQVLGKMSLVATNGGSTFWGSNNAIVAKPGPHWGGWISTNDIDRGFKERNVWTLDNEVDRDKVEWAQGKKFLKENTGQIPVLMLGKILRILNPVPDSPNKKYVLIVAVAAVPLLILALAGVVLSCRQKILNDGMILVWANLLVLAATVFIFYGYERFRMPYEPFLAMYAAVALTAFLEKTFPKRRFF